MNIAIRHCGITLTLNEPAGLWECELFARGSESLNQAKERIERCLSQRNKPDKKPFERFEVWFRGYGLGDCNKYKKVTVTSLTDDGQAWLTLGKDRVKESHPQNLIPVCPHNDAIVTKILALDHDIEALRDMKTNLEAKLQHWKKPE